MDGTRPVLLPGFTSVVDDVVAGLAVALRADRAVALVLDAAGTGYRAVASVGLTDAAREAIDHALDDDARSCWQRLATADLPVYFDAADGDVRSLWRGVAAAPPHLATPLIGADGALLGVILLAMPRPRADDLIVAARLARLAVVAIEQARAAEQRGGELARTAVLLDIVREVDRPAELPEVLAAICRKSVEAFGSRQATVFFRSRRHRASLPLADHGTPPHVAARFVGGRFIGGNIPHEDEVRSGRTVVIVRATGSAEDRALLDVVEVSMLVMVPLRDEEGAVHGTLTVGFAEAHPCTGAELEALEMVARHATMAIIRARLLHRTAQSAHFRAAVSGLAIELNAATSRSETLETLCRRGCELFGVDAGALLLERGGRLIAAATRGPLDADGELEPDLDDPESPVTRAFRERTIVLEKDRPRRDDAAPLDRLRSLLAIPLVESDGAIGVLVFGALRPRLFRSNVVAEAPILGALTVGVLRNLALMGQLQESNQRLARLSDVKDQFLANVSHELRTPLNVIIGFAQLALEDTFGEPPPELRQIIERMLASARQQLTLVHDLLDVSRLELNGLQVKVAPMAMQPLLAEMEYLAINLVRQRPVRVVVERPSRDVWVLADADRVRQILTNLLGNAAKFTDSGTIGIRVAVEGERVAIDLFDTGVGIAAADLDGIFEPFRQVDGGRAALGTGLGLAIARRLTALMQGTLTVTSTPGRGSTFSLTLPVASPNLEAPDDREPAAHAQGSRERVAQ